jgi:hypothetical protein
MRKREELRDDMARLARELAQWAAIAPKLAVPLTEAATACKRAVAAIDASNRRPIRAPVTLPPLPSLASTR